MQIISSNSNLIDKASNDAGNIVYIASVDRLLIDGRDVYQGYYMGAQYVDMAAPVQPATWEDACAFRRAVDHHNDAALDAMRDASNAVASAKEQSVYDACKGVRGGYLDANTY